MQTFDEIIAEATEKLQATLRAAEPNERSEIVVWAVYTSKHQDGFIQVGGENPFPQACEFIRPTDPAESSWSQVPEAIMFRSLHQACTQAPISPVTRSTPTIPKGWLIVQRGGVEFMVEPAFPGLDRRAFFEDKEAFNFIYYDELMREGTRARSYGYGLASGGYPWAF
jgi:hypothetical protein